MTRERHSQERGEVNFAEALQSISGFLDLMLALCADVEVVQDGKRSRCQVDGSAIGGGVVKRSLDVAENRSQEETLE